MSRLCCACHDEPRRANLWKYKTTDLARNWQKKAIQRAAPLGRDSTCTERVNKRVNRGRDYCNLYVRILLILGDVNDAWSSEVRSQLDGALVTYTDILPMAPLFGPYRQLQTMRTSMKQKTSFKNAVSIQPLSECQFLYGSQYSKMLRKPEQE
jgi:hypothetical protein